MSSRVEMSSLRVSTSSVEFLLFSNSQPTPASALAMSKVKRLKRKQSQSRISQDIIKKETLIIRGISSNRSRVDLRILQ